MKKGVVALSTFALLILLFILIFIFTFFFVDGKRDGVYSYNAQKEALYSASSLRSALLNLVAYNQTTLNYANIFDKEGIKLNLEDQFIYSSIQTQDTFVNLTVSMYGISFCSEYTITPTVSSTFSYDGTCISVT